MKYNTIVIDPPWKVSTGGPDAHYTKKQLPHEMPYKIMCDDELRKFDIDRWASESCKLFMWCVHSKLPLGLELLKTWGFKYYCTMTWYKVSGITMQGFHRDTELILFGYRGKADWPWAGVSIPTMIWENATRHSVKPDKFYQCIRWKMPNPKIDLFARGRHDGFDQWGDEAE